MVVSRAQLALLGQNDVAERVCACACDGSEYSLRLVLCGGRSAGCVSHLMLFPRTAAEPCWWSTISGGSVGGATI